MSNNGIHSLFGRYLTVWRQSWAERHTLAAPTRMAAAVEFLPAHLELIEKPPHPAPRWTARILIALLVAVVLLALFGHLDIVAVASGKLIPNARVKVIQPAVTGVVRRILVSDGTRVHAGQLLMELDPSQAEADTNKATAARVDAELTVARADALLQAQSRGTKPEVAAVYAAPPERQRQAQDYANGAFNEYHAKMTALQAELTKRQAELATTRAQIDKLHQTAPLAREQAENYKSLAADKYVARTDYLDKEQSAISQEQELAAQISHTHELEAAIAEQQGEINATGDTFRREQLNDLGKAQEVLSQATGDQTKAEVRRALMRMVAPVDGTVQQLAVHTVGGVVTTAQPVLELVPDDTLEVDAHLENKDIGFVEVGQKVTVKIDAFPYTRFGTLEGTVVEVSNDAASDRKGGSYFPVRIRLPSNKLHVEQRWVTLTPGMDVKAEIHTGRRTVANYFLSPLITTVGQSLRER